MISKSGFTGKSVQHIRHSLKRSPGIFRNAFAFISMFSALAVGGLVHAETATIAPPPTFKHPVLDRWKSSDLDAKQGQRKNSEKLAQEIMNLTDAQVLAVIPEQTPLIHHQCPVCARKKPVEILQCFFQSPGFDMPGQCLLAGINGACFVAWP